MNQCTPTAIALFSGGLDSMLACRLLMEQGIRVQAIKFVTPFFGYDLLAREEAYRRQVREQYGIEVSVRDVSAPYLELLRNPAHGFGKNFNPCVDCKILLVTEARRLFAEFGASFLITGEVLGQRPMSQRHDTLRVIERDSGCEGLLLRPLCAKRLKPTQPELEGLVDRERLLGFSGRSRAPQIALAARYGIEDFPSPAGGCILTDPILAARIRRFYEEQPRFTPADIRLLLVGRLFRLEHGGLLAMGRKEQENDRLIELLAPEDWMIMAAHDRPGPTAILRFSDHPADLRAAAGLVARYSKKSDEGPTEVEVVAEKGERVEKITAAPLPEEAYRPWRR
jgi:tRNA U34 2-thiouridine synthase MnmA/TrmU